jgi:hypothetical protein
MLIMEIISILLGILSGFVNLSTTFYLILRSLIDKSFSKANETYGILISKKIVSDPSAVRELLKLIRSSLLKFDTAEFSDYGLLRRWKETVKLEFKPGEIERRNNFVGINPIYGYNSNGDETFVADKNTFHQQFVSIVTSGQQKTAFLILLSAFILEILSLYVH